MAFRRATSGVVGGTVLLLLWGEYEHWRASHRRLGLTPAVASTAGVARGPAAAGVGVEAVVVLGFRNGGRRANAVNRWRVRAALRSRQPAAALTRLVLCGGPAGGAVSEAELMALYAKGTCGYRGEMELETTSLSTWENVKNAIPLLEDAARIKIVSHSLHAEKARAYLHLLRPDLAARLVRAKDYRFGEWILAKPFLAIVGKRNLHSIDTSPTDTTR
ncbi:YdcF family protein [Kribbella qitaiheensis]|uniref:YdcF family protein n=1 Tax=Kribbella qitaiheensis TaxID=1544730 RepID=A0A7G6WZV9_9ACTN|nr:ElyC/SanA/YdcF family protein [Kribbella qitaiheensis]QNE19524.1 YdcF family protein [Kribbella qitaiheensis]